MAGFSKNLVTAWLVTWGLLGLVSGLILALGDTGHLPALWLVTVVTIGALVAGFVAVVGFASIVYLFPPGLGRSLLGRTGAGAIAGAISAFLLGWFVLGVEWRHAIIWGAAAGVLSVVVSLRPRANTPGT